jgi:hypothetical protein
MRAEGSRTAASFLAARVAFAIMPVSGQFGIRNSECVITNQIPNSEYELNSCGRGFDRSHLVLAGARKRTPLSQTCQAEIAVFFTGQGLRRKAEIFSQPLVVLLTTSEFVGIFTTRKQRSF